MQHRQVHRIYRYTATALLLLSIPLFWLVRQASQSVLMEPTTFVFSHTVVELFAVVVAMLIFSTGYQAILSQRKGAVILLGIGFLGVGILDFLHTMAYVGMPDAITANSPQKSMYFWVAARLLAAATLLVYVLVPNGGDISPARKRLAVVGMLLLTAAVSSLGLLAPDQAPTLFVTGQGQTPLKINLEWSVVCLHLLTLATLWLRRSRLADEAVPVLGFAVALAAVSELYFTQIGIIDMDLANAVGHVYKVAAYLLLLEATFNESMRRPLERIQAQNQREKVVLNAAPDGVLWVNSAGRILMANPAMETLTGYSPSQLQDQGVDIFLPVSERASAAESMHRHFRTGQPGALGGVDLDLICQDGHRLPVSLSLGTWVDGNERHTIAYIRDLTERKKNEASLHHQASHDELTGLANRWLFRQRLNEALLNAQQSGRTVAVLLIDLDHFKNVNDSFGHATGDALLKIVSQRIATHMRPEDALARMGGDEFGVLMVDLADADAAVAQATALLVALQSAFALHKEHVYTSASVGLSFFPTDGTDADSLLRYADMALYHAKDSGRGMYACYSSDMDKHVQEDLRLHARLKDALSQGSLQLHYQPQVDVQTGAVVGAEALLRWNDPVLGSVPPTRFIPVAEATGLILPLSQWVLDTACAQIAQWTQAGTPLRVAVNVSAQQFRQHNLPQTVQSTLLRHQAQACWLEIEITESVAMYQPDQACEQLHALAQLGCTISLDDFGTGYSSMAYLKALPVNSLKIDKRFMDDIPGDANDAAIARAIIALAKSLGLHLVAEGVETDAQLRFLRQFDCETYQGWLFSKAIPAEQLGRMLQAQVGRKPSAH
jgi:diguanylate cyclase (GGDEF)-like protein/PAS domain S-box-containing protein